ncbi:MAG: transketolase family protein, partial [Candidatus Aegiribacteria sp.]|nr:transketolase family protein [Candidatus Aegiribacteria sp.]
VSVKPLDRELLLGQAEKTGAVIVAEDHQVTGGLFGAVAETLALEMPVLMDTVAMQGSFGASGSPAEVMKKFGLTTSAIAEKAERILH